MRSASRSQLPLTLPIAAHPHAKLLLLRIGRVLDSMQQLHELLVADLVPPGSRADLGRNGLTAQQGLRIFVLSLTLHTTFDQLAFHLADSPTYRAFCLLGLGEPTPKRASLHDNVSRLSPETLQAVHRVLVEHAVDKGIESAQVVRTDTTPVAAPMGAPSDSFLLGDAVRVLERLWRQPRA